MLLGTSPILVVFASILLSWLLFVVYSRVKSGAYTRGKVVRCFYCHQKTRLPLAQTASIGADLSLRKNTKHKMETPYDWHCQYCQNRNLRDSQGELVDQVPAMFSELSNPISQWKNNTQFVETRRRRRCQGLSDTELLSDDEELNIPFCNGCLSNHNMVLQLLATYKPDESNPNFKDYDTAIEMYRIKVEERYPSLCKECAPRVENRIAQTNARVRARYFGESLLRSKKTPFVNNLPLFRWWKVLIWLSIFVVEWISRGLMFYMCWSGHVSLLRKFCFLLAQ
ncbi:Ima1 N-terminal domain-containing protein [Syncephalis fuscata]|nr:Ima1 N-terminal domain-containing protein [Syncephalis fuscata]